MQDLQVKKQNFERAKNAIKNFSNNLPKTPQLNKFEENTLWGALSKNVTGKEMNQFVDIVAQQFIESNKTSVKIIKEFNDIYNVFEVLDKEYIEYFQTSIDNLIKVSDDAQKAGNDALSAQKEIDRTIQVLKITIEKLKKHETETDEKIKLLNDRVEITESNQNSKHAVQLNSSIHNENREVNSSDNTENFLNKKNDDYGNQLLKNMHLLKLEFKEYKEITNKKMIISNIFVFVLFLLIIVQFFIQSK